MRIDSHGDELRQLQVGSDHAEGSELGIRQFRGQLGDPAQRIRKTQIAGHGHHGIEQPVQLAFHADHGLGPIDQFLQQDVQAQPVQARNGRVPGVHCVGNA
jgi:hypothetical protein